MAGIPTVPPPSPGTVDTLIAAAPAAVEFHYTQTDSFVALLQQLSASLLTHRCFIEPEAVIASSQ